MTRRDVDRAGAGVHGYEIRDQNHGRAGEKGMLRADAFEFVAGKRFHRFAGRLEAGGGAKLWDQFVGEDERFGGSGGALDAELGLKGGEGAAHTSGDGGV